MIWSDSVRKCDPNTNNFCRDYQKNIEKNVSKKTQKHHFYKEIKKSNAPFVLDEWQNWEFKKYTADYLLRLEIETRRLENLTNQKLIKTGSTRNFSFFGLRIGI